MVNGIHIKLLCFQYISLSRDTSPSTEFE